jgi:hypothetical protein
MAFVVVQYLDPNYKRMLVELFQSGTPLTVFQAKERMRSVYPSSDVFAT